MRINPVPVLWSLGAIFPRKFMLHHWYCGHSGDDGAGPNGNSGADASQPWGAAGHAGVRTLTYKCARLPARAIRNPRG